MASPRSVASRGRAAARCQPMATSRPTRRWCWPSRRPEPARARRTACGSAAMPIRTWRGPRWPARASSISAWRPASGSAHLAAMLGGGPRLWPLDARCGPQDQRRICLGQSDRADACRPLPGRGGRRRARQPPGLCRLRRDQGILSSTTPARRSRCWRARRCCATAQALGEDIGEIPAGLYPGDYLVPVGPRSPPSSAEACSTCRRTRRWPSSGAHDRRQ